MLAINVDRVDLDTILVPTSSERIGLQGGETHSFRCTYITRLRDLGYLPAQIQRRTGHKQRANLLHYFDQI